jgi:hypothetical protein
MNEGLGWQRGFASVTNCGLPALRVAYRMVDGNCDRSLYLFAIPSWSAAKLKTWDLDQEVFGEDFDLKRTVLEEHTTSSGVR